MSSYQTPDLSSGQDRMRLVIIFTWYALSVKGSVCQEWVVYWSPTDLQNGPIGGIVSTPLPIKLLSLASSPHRLDSIQKGGCVKSGRSGIRKPDKLGLSCKSNKCSDAGAKDLDVLPTHEPSPCIGDAGSTRPGWMPPQVQVSKVERTRVALVKERSPTYRFAVWVFTPSAG